MNVTSETPLHRLLIVDDDPQVLGSYRRALRPLLACAASSDSDELDTLAAALFDTRDHGLDPACLIEIVTCNQGRDAVERVAQARAEGQPFSVCFIDMRMPPGIDGLETGRQIRNLDRDINIVIVTGYSDHSLRHLTEAIRPRDKLFYLSKPFEVSEIRQMTSALVHRWSTDQRIERELADRVADLERLNAELQRREAIAFQVARQDPMTGLPNRLGLREELESRRAAPAPKPFSLLFLDLDRFKAVNDTLGHAAGDDLICQLVGRLETAIATRGFLARLGGDEFAVVSSEPILSTIAPLCLSILATCGPSFAVSGRLAFIGISVGIAQFDDAGIDDTELMRRADMALYAAKAEGRGRVSIYNHAMAEKLVAEHKLAADLRDAIEHDHLRLVYQPQVTSPNYEIYGVEALARWDHPTLGPIPPNEFVAVAEKSDLIRQLGDWVIRRAFSDAQAWPHLITSINVSPAQFRYEGFVDGVLAMARDQAIDPTRFEIELTENTLLDDLGAAARDIMRLKQAGFAVALDDFGTGYSSLNYLRQVPFDRLKIDRSFVKNVTGSSEAALLVQSIVSLGLALDLSITAEGVEEWDQSTFLNAIGCRQMQGYFFYKPLGPAEIAALERPAAWRQAG